MGLLVVVLLWSNCGCADTESGPSVGMPAEMIETVLIENGEGRCTIVIAEDADPGLHEAARDMAYHLEKMSGASIPVVNDMSESEGIPIYIGTPPEGTGLPVDIKNESLFWPDGYLLVADGERVILAAPRTDGVRSAVYGLLEDHLGCHWFSPRTIGEHIPKRATVKLSIDKGYEVVKPLYSVRGPWYSSTRPLGPGLDGKTGLTSEDWNQWYRRNRQGGPQGYYGHNWYRIWTPEILRKDPEMASFSNGKRHPEVTAHRHQVCLSHPRAVDVAVEYFTRYFNENPDMDYGSFSANDGSRFCICAGCKAMASNVAGQTLIVANQIAEQMADIHPGKKLAFLVYEDTWDSPQEGVRPHENLIGVICSANVNEKKWMDQIKSKTGSHRDAVDYRRGAEAWASMLAESWVYDYYGWFPGPYTMFSKLVQETAWQESVGVDGCASEFINREMGTDSMMWVIMRRGWGHSMESQIDEFYSAYFGAAADDMRAVYEMIENHVVNAEKQGVHEVDQSITLKLYPVKLMDAALARTAIAEQKVSGDSVRLARVRRDKILLQMTRLFVEASTAIRAYYENSDPASRTTAFAAANAYLALNEQYGLQMPDSAGLLLGRPVIDKPGAFDVSGYLRVADGRTWRARTFEGYTRGDYGLYLAPGGKGKIVYEIKAVNGLKIRDMKCEILGRGKLTLDVSLDDGRTWLIPGTDEEGRFALTGLLAGQDRFLLRLRIENDTGAQTCVLESWSLTGTAE